MIMRDEYTAIQIARSRAKFDLCKVPEVDTRRYAACLPASQEAILCLGVRSGIELDRFRIAFPDCPVIQGVEINPQCERPDVLIGSFDALPTEWVGRFTLVFSNAFDHAFDPIVTAHEWQRVLKPGGCLIVALNGASDPQPGDADCLGFTCDDLVRWFDQCGFIGEQQGHYREAWFVKSRERS